MPQLFWNQTSNPSPFIATQPIGYGVLKPVVGDTGEFSFDQYIPTTVSNAVKNASRLFDSTKTVVDQTDTQPAWWNIWAKVKASVSSVNDSLQSTLIKIIIILFLVGVGFIYFQAKVTNLAK